MAPMSGAYPGDWRQMFRPDIPNAARIYDYMVGGKENFQAPRRDP